MIPKESLLTLFEFPRFSNKTMGYPLNECEMDVLFGIDSTAEYIEYSESKKNGGFYYGVHSCGLPGITPDYSDDFKAEFLSKAADTFRRMKPFNGYLNKALAGFKMPER